MVIKEIRASKFRGLLDFQLLLDGKGLVLLGPNGSGKSSVVNAIEFVFTGGVRALEKRQGVSLSKHGHHVDADKSEMSATVVVSSPNAELTRTHTSLPDVPNELRDQFQVAEQGTFILRRAQLLEFIDAKPAERAETLSNLLGLGDVDEAELEFKRARDAFEGQLQSATNAAEDGRNSLSGLLGRDIQSPREVRQAVNVMLRNSGLPELASTEDIDSPIEKLQKRITRVTNENRLARTHRICSTVRESPVPQSWRELAEETSKELKELKDAEQTARVRQLQALVAANAIVSEETSLCPVCEQAVEGPKLSASLESRIRSLSALSDKASGLRRTAATLKGNLQTLNSQLERLLPDLRSSEGFEAEVKSIEGILEDLRELTSDVSSAQNIEGDFDASTFSDLADRLGRCYKAIGDLASKQVDESSLSKEEEKAFGLIQTLRSCADAMARWEAARRSEALSQNRFTISEHVYDVFSRQRRSVIEGVYASLVDRINYFYNIVHPDEEHGNIALNVVRRASALLAMDAFGQKAQDPRALASEGHLDTLGLCIFLAFYELSSETFPVMVLDDVLTTVDSQHRRRIADLLLTCFKHVQLIITTHDEIWSKQIAAVLRAHKRTHEFQNQEIIRWTRQQGLVLKSVRNEWEGIEERLNAGEKDDAGTRGRIYLERVLKRACSAMRAPVPYREDGDYTVFDLFDPATQRLVKKLSGEGREVVEHAINRLEKTSFLGNLLAHDNEQNKKLDVSEVREFCEAVHGLMLCISCDSCKQPLVYEKNAKRFECRSPKCEDPTSYRTK